MQRIGFKFEAHPAALLTFERRYAARHLQGWRLTALETRPLLIPGQAPDMERPVKLIFLY